MIWNMHESLKFKIIWSNKGKGYKYIVSACYCALLPFMLAHTEGRVSSGDSTDSTGTKDMAELYSSVWWITGFPLAWATFLSSVLQGKSNEKSNINQRQGLLCGYVDFPLS